MKAKIRKTGEVVDVICYGGSPDRRSDVLDYVYYIDSRGVEHTDPSHLNYYWDFEPIEETTDEHWRYIRERAAIAAMQGVMSCYDAIAYKYDKNYVARLAVGQADALIEELKKK